MFKIGTLAPAERNARVSPASRLRRERILHEGALLLSQGGLAGVTLGSLADRAGMSKSGLFAHFRSKESVQIELLGHIASLGRSEFIEPAMASPEGLPRLRAYFHAWLGWAPRAGLPGGCPFAAAAFELDDLESPVRERVSQIMREMVEIVLGMIDRAISLGHLRDDTDANQLLWEMNGIYLGHHTSQRFVRDPKADERAQIAFEALIDRFLPEKHL